MDEEDLSYASKRDKAIQFRTVAEIETIKQMRDVMNKCRDP